MATLLKQPCFYFVSNFSQQHLFEGIRNISETQQTARAKINTFDDMFTHFEYQKKISRLSYLKHFKGIKFHLLLLCLKKGRENAKFMLKWRNMVIFTVFFQDEGWKGSLISHCYLLNFSKIKQMWLQSKKLKQSPQKLTVSFRNEKWLSAWETVLSLPVIIYF